MDGGRVYYDGSSMVCMNGKIYSIEKQFSVGDVDVQLGVMDLDEVRSYRMGNQSRNVQSSHVLPFTEVFADIFLTRQTNHPLTKQTPLNLLTPEEEISGGPPLWMWDYLRRSGARGFFLPLSGGADSGAVAAMVANMCKMLYDSIVQDKNEETLADVRKVVKDDNFMPTRY